MLIRTYADIESLKGKDVLGEAERLLVENCKRGELSTLGDGSRPDGPSPERTIRADLLRYLILGGCERCRVHEKGVQVAGAWIEGQLDLSFASTKGAVRLLRCAFAEPIEADQASFNRLVLNGSSLPGLNAEGASIKGDVFLSNLNSNGKVSFSGAKIGGQLSCNGAELNGRGSLAFNAEGAAIYGSVFLRELISKGRVNFCGAKISGQFSCNGAEFYNDETVALNAQAATISGGLFLDNVKSSGEVSLSGAEIGGQLSAKGAELTGGERQALNAQGLTVTGGVSLTSLKCRGMVSFSGAQITGFLSCGAATLNAAEEVVLNAQGARIGGNVYLVQLKSVGEITLSAAEIGGQLICYESNLDGGDGVALCGQRMIVRGSLFWCNLESVVGTIDLNAARLGDMVDDQQSWDKVSDFTLVGMTFDMLVHPFDLSFRKAWLLKGSEFNQKFYPQPYQQLAKFYRESGHRYEAREILVAKEIEQRKATRKAIREGKARTESWLIPDALVFLNFLWDRTTRYIAGYGYKPWLSLWWLAALVAIMMGLAQLTWNAGDFAPNSAVVLTSPDWKAIADGPSQNPAADWSGPAAPGKDYETFYSFAYALDVVVPVLDLGQTDAWAPSPARGEWGYRLFYLQKMFVVLGWVVTAIAAAAISGMIRRDD